MNMLTETPIAGKILDQIAHPKPSNLKTTPLDSRFPNQNQTRYCYQMFLDFHRCQKSPKGTPEICKYFNDAYKVMCPKEWYEKWEEQVQEGTFAGEI